jgi:hypothetical protein
MRAEVAAQLMDLDQLLAAADDLGAADKVVTAHTIVILIIKKRLPAHREL